MTLLDSTSFGGSSGATNLLPKSTDACVQPCSSQDLPRHHSEVDRSILTSGGSYFLEQAEEVVATDSMGALDPSVASHVDPPWTPASAFALDQAPSALAAGAVEPPESALSPSGVVCVPAGPGPDVASPESPQGPGLDSNVDHMRSSTPALPSSPTTVQATGSAEPAAGSSALVLDPGVPTTSNDPSSTPPPHARTWL
jgi:hypothetical protein